VNSLEVAASSAWWLHAGAALILVLHVAGGTIALLSGAAALTFRKGSRRHRIAGNVFFGSMLVMGAIAAAVAPFLLSPEGEPKWFDSLAGTFTCYLVATGWVTIRRKAGTIGQFEVAACLFAAILAAVAVMFGVQAANSPTGSLGGFGAQGYYTFGGLIALAAALDLNVILRGGVFGVPRLSRHLWRLCVALFIAAGAFFFGQQRVMPEFIQGSGFLAIPPFATLALMVFWLLRLRLAKVFKRIAGKRARRPRTAARPI